MVKVWVDRAERERRGSNERAAIVKSSRGGLKGLRCNLEGLVKGSRLTVVEDVRIISDRAAVAPKGKEGSLSSHLILRIVCGAMEQHGRQKSSSGFL